MLEKASRATPSMRREVSTWTSTFRGRFFLARMKPKLKHFSIGTRNRQTSVEQKSPEINPNLYGNFIYNNGGIISQWRKDGFLLVKECG